MSFYEIVEKYRDFNFDEYFQNVTKDDVLRSIESDNMSDFDLLNLLSPKSKEILESMAQKANKLSLNNFGRTILLYTPMYISNYCINRCSYCGYNIDNKINRKKLTQDQIEKEAVEISKLGFKHLLLLTGESNHHTPTDYIKESVKTIKNYFPSIGIEIYPMSEDDYKIVIAEGVDGLTVYQETYDQEKYDKVHLSGPKKDYKFRLDAPERGAKAGMRNISIGALLGLSDFRKDAFFTAMHGRYLRKKYPNVEIGYSVPRIRPCEGGFKDLNEVNDEDFVQILLAYRLFEPKAGINVSTRESKSFRENLIPLGVTRMSAGVSTQVGGHSLEDKGTGQFDINDESCVQSVKESIIKKGYQPIFKDWERI